MRIEKVFLVGLQDAVDLEIVDRDALEAEIPAGSAPSWVELRFESRRDEVLAIRERLESTGTEYYLREERSFTRREIRDAKFLHVDPALEIECRPGGEHTWDWSEACEHCMRVPEQTGRIAVDPKIVEGVAVARGRRGELLVHEHIATRMIKEDISGCVLREVLFEGEEGARHSSPYFQVVPSIVLPSAVHPPTRFASLDDASCPLCGRGGLYLESMLYYDVDLDDLADVNVTSELFGEGPTLSPEIVISPRFFNLLVSAGAELESAEPVMFV
jgi:hypothetical protein